MNTRSSITPFSGPQAPGRANFRLTVITMFALHGVFLAGLLLQGCKRPSSGPPVAGTAPETNAPVTPGYELAAPTTQSSWAAQQSTQAVTSVVGMGQTAVAPVTGLDTTTQPIITEPQLGAQPPVTEPTEYIVKPRDVPATIAKAHGVTLKAFMEANPGLDPRKLQIGQKVNVPAPVPKEQGAAGAVTAGGQGTFEHVVKSGENLTRIARRYGVTVPELRSANNLKTDRINVGQKLQIPGTATKDASAPAGAGGGTASSLVMPPSSAGTAPTANRAPGQ